MIIIRSNDILPFPEINLFKQIHRSKRMRTSGRIGFGSGLRMKRRNFYICSSWRSEGNAHCCLAFLLPLFIFRLVCVKCASVRMCGREKERVRGSRGLDLEGLCQRT